MGKKKQPNATESFGQLVSKAALNNLLPHIQNMVSQLGQRLAFKQASTTEMIFSRIVIIEKIILEKFGITEEELALRLAKHEDDLESYVPADVVQKDDLVRVEIKVRPIKDTEFKGSSRHKVYKVGSGETLGNEIENALIGMKAAESKDITLGNDVVNVVINTISRSTQPVPELTPSPETPNENTAEG